MKYRFFFIFFLIGMIRPIGGQKAVNTFNTEGWWKPAGPTFSPEIRENNQVTFRLKGENAESVVLQLGEWEVKSHPMQKDGNGVWQVTVGPIPPGIYQYNFLVNGVTLPDMANPVIKAGTSLYGSVLDIRGETPLFDQSQNVPHGDIHIIEYTSTPLQKPRTMYVYVPAEYHTRTEQNYPVLYLRHGGGDNEASWVKDGRAAVILDNLIAAGKAVPMFIVMTNGLTDGSWSGGSTVEGMRVLEEELLMDIMPLVEKRYRIEKNKTNRAIAGLSMGGGQAYVIGLRNTDIFHYIGQFSAGLVSDGKMDAEKYMPGILTQPEKINKNLKLLWFSCGTKDIRYQGHLDFVAGLKREGIRVEFHEMPYGHEWQFWRHQLYEFSQRLFK